jgi:predicted dehydrogenase
MTRTPDAVALAFVGCGQAARTHAQTLRSVGHGVPLFFASRDPARARKFSHDFAGAGDFASYEAAWTDPRVTAVVVTTPPDRHLEITLAALAAGKDVIVEKPAFFEVGDFAAVAESARQVDRRVFVAENYFYKPLRRRLAGLLAEGIIGEPLLLRLNAVKQQNATGWRADRTHAGGGGLFEGGIHWINFVANLGPQIQRVSGYRAGGGSHEQGVEETLAVAMEFSGGMVGTLSFSWEVPSPLRGVRLSSIYGREGSVWFESNGIFVAARGVRTRVFFPGLRDLSGYRAMWIDFLDALRTGNEPAMTLDLAERDVRLIRDIYSSLDA